MIGELVRVVGTEIRPTFTSKSFEKGVIREFVEEKLKW
jgi:hypothetical protein